MIRFTKRNVTTTKNNAMLVRTNDVRRISKYSEEIIAADEKRLFFFSINFCQMLQIYIK